MKRANDPHGELPPAAYSAGPAALIDTALLERLLLASRPEPLESLAHALQKPIARVRQEIERLRQARCELEIHPQHGVRLVRAGLETWLDYVQRFCPLESLAGERVVEVYRKTASTQDLVRRMIAARGLAANGAVAIADEQTAGRGRLGRRWLAPAGAAVTFSRAFLAGASSPAASVDRMMFATSVAVARAVEIVAGAPSLDVRIKWPNDILVNSRKIAGILVETLSPAAGKPGGAIVGVGINVALTPEDLPADDPALRDRVTSLALCGRLVDRLLVLTETIRQIDRALAQENLVPLVDEWRQRSTSLSQRVTVLHNGKKVDGQVIDLDPYEGLIVRSAAGAILHFPAATTTML